MDVQAPALREQRGDAGALMAIGGVGEQQEWWEGFFVGVGGAQVGDGVDLVLVEQPGAVQRLCFKDRQGVVEVGGDGQPGGAGRGDRGAEQRRRGRRRHHYVCAGAGCSVPPVPRAAVRKPRAAACAPGPVSPRPAAGHTDDS